MLFGWKIDNPSGALQPCSLGDKHSPDHDFFALARILIKLEVHGERFLKHQGDAFPHDSNRIDRIDQSIDFGFQQIAAQESNHKKYQSFRTIVSNFRLRLATTARITWLTASVQQQIPSSAWTGICFHISASAWYRSFLAGSFGS